MKPLNRAKVIIATTFATFLLTTAGTHAERATSDEMELVCKNWMSYMVNQKGTWASETNPRITDVQKIVENDTLIAACYTVAPSGYVVVPVLKELPPIKACSQESKLDVDDTDGFAALLREVLVDATRAFVDMYGSLEASQPVRGKAAFGREHRAQWDRYTLSREEFDASLVKADRDPLREVGPLMTTSWRQGDPYNVLCPMGDGGRCVVGCVATAAAQIMKYHNWPPFGIDSAFHYWMGDESCGGSTPGSWLRVDCSDTYDWDNIPDHAPAWAPQEEIDAVSELCYEVGVAFHMQYGRCGSGSYVFSGMTVFPEYFRYKDTIERVDRPGHTAQQWFDIAKEEIDAGRPISYRITRHAIVCDGWRVVDEINQLHYNYGWHDGHNTWYTVDWLYCNWEGCNAGDQMMLLNVIPDRDIMFTVDTMLGPCPLEVQFTGLSDLAVDSWTYDFGDGDSAFLQSPVHVYDAPGIFDATLTIQAGELIRTLERPRLIMAIADTIVAIDTHIAPDSTAEVTIYARNTTPVTEMRIPVAYSGELALMLDSFSTVGCRTDYFEIIQKPHSNPGKQATFKLRCSDSGTSPELAPGAGPVIKLYFSTPWNAIPGMTSTLNLDGYSVYEPMYLGSVYSDRPNCQSGIVTCASCCTGMRGNVDNDPADEVSIADLVHLVTYMFQDGPEPLCWDEADINASFSIDISDLIHLVTYMFQNGDSPLPCPYEN